MIPVSRVFLAVAVLLFCSGCSSPTGGTGAATSPFAVPAEAGLEDVSHPTHVLGTGTPGSITEAAFRAAVAAGGVITFNGGTAPFTITLTQTAKVFNDQADVVIDGGGLVTLSGGGAVRILYQNTRDPAQVLTTNDAQNQDHPHLTVQNLTFADGVAPAAAGYDESGGGAIYAYGGRLKIFGCSFVRNQGPQTGPDVGGGAVRAFAQYNGLPVYVVNSTFGGSTANGNFASNGGALSSIGVSWSIFNSTFVGNRAVGYKGNPAENGTAGGGSGGAIYNDGNTMTLTIVGSAIQTNTARAYGSAIFFVSNDHTGTMNLKDTTFVGNTGGGWDTAAHPGISMFDDTVTNFVNVSWQ